MGSDDVVPRVIVLDLDGTLWSPEMYQLWGGGGSPFRLDTSDKGTNSSPHSSAAIDKAGTKVRLIGESRNVLQQLLTDPKWRNTYLAVSSTCDEPRWAMELLQLFKFTDRDGKQVPMLSLFGDLLEIYSANKAQHHRTILKKVQKLDPSIKDDFSQFVFYDNQTNNIENVRKIGVSSVYCPSGLVGGVFERGIHEWREKQKKCTL
ncbi:Magnesium-dependent phosphatase-1 [Trypanosoma melophagium]|uniref:Magnesium-dependent phosphatase-1 n=1 Tax=Trypanosoma melophagium TaxID=715481 RepID=UPI00351A6EAE|nr:Magnesium-dependent phosphatase-1 [Trypanosoma melophagium]